IGDYLYQSNYTSGLRILDIKNREKPYQKAFFDIYPYSEAAIFEGNWSNYAWYPNGIIAASDITGGLFVLRNTFQDAVGSADLSVTVSTSNTEYYYQDPYTYTVQIDNNGVDEADNVYVTLRLSQGGIFNSQSESTSECEVVLKQLMECRLDGPIAAGGTRTLTVQAAGFSDTQVTSIGMASADQVDVKPGDNRVIQSVKLKQIPQDSGGGAAGWLLLPALLGLAWLRRRIRQ